MNKKKDSLFEVIHNLTPSEKRYFKLFAKGSQSQPNNKYLRLFDAINRQSNYKEEELLKKLGYEKNPNGLAVAKNYLHQLIIKSLRQYGSPKNQEREVIELLQETYTLYIRRLFAPAQKQVEKARRIAEEARRNDLLILVYKWERRLVEQGEEVVDFLKAYHDLMEREKTATYNLKVNTSLYTQYKKLFFHNLREGFQKRGKARDSFFALFQHPLLEEQIQPAQPVARLYYYLCYYEYFHGMRDRTKRNEISVTIIELFRKSPFLKEVDKESYLTAIVNYLFCQLQMGAFDFFLEKIKDLRNLEISKGNHFLIRRKEIDYFHLMMHYYEVTGQYEEAIEVLAPQVKEYFASHRHAQIDKDEFYLKITTAWIYFITGDAEEAVIWLSYLENEIDRNAFVDYFKVSRMTQLVVHYTLKNYTVVESLAKSTLRLLSTKNKLTETDGFILKFFKKAGALDDFPEKQKTMLQQLKEEIETIHAFTKTTPPPYRLEDLLLWIDSQLLRKSKLVLLKERTKVNQSMEKGRKVDLISSRESFVLRRGN